MNIVVHIEGNKILITKEEIAAILVPFDSDKPIVEIRDINGKSIAYTIDLSDTYVSKKSDIIEIEKLLG